MINIIEIMQYIRIEEGNSKFRRNKYLVAKLTKYIPLKLDRPYEWLFNVVEFVMGYRDNDDLFISNPEGEWHTGKDAAFWNPKVALDTRFFTEVKRITKREYLKFSKPQSKLVEKMMHLKWNINNIFKSIVTV